MADRPTETDRTRLRGREGQRERGGEGQKERNREEERKGGRQREKVGEGGSETEQMYKLPVMPDIV